MYKILEHYREAGFQAPVSDSKVQIWANGSQIPAPETKTGSQAPDSQTEAGSLALAPSANSSFSLWAESIRKHMIRLKETTGILYWKNLKNLEK